MSELTSRERLMAVWNRQPVRRVPWAPMLGDSMLSSQRQYWKMLTPEQQRAIRTSYRYPSVVSLPANLNFVEPIIMKMTREVGGDYISGVKTIEVVDVNVEVESKPIDEAQISYTFHTPWGILNEIVAAGDSSETIFRVKFAVSEMNHYDIIGEIVSSRSYKQQYDSYHKKEEILGKHGASTVWGPDQPLVALYRIRDPVELIYDFNEDLDRMKNLLNLLHQKNLDAYQMIAQGPGQVVETGMAFITTRLISPRMFESFVLPYLSEYSSILHNAGKILICHMCGHVHHLLPLLKAAGIDGIDSLSPPPIGDTEMEAFWEKLGDNAILQGGLDVNTLHKGTVDQVRFHVHDVLKRSRGKHLILRSADEIPYGTPLENLKAVSAELELFYNLDE
jgi:hypothetical protein